MIYPFAFKQAFDGVVNHIEGLEADSEILFQPLLDALVPALDLQKAQVILASAPGIHNYQWAEFEDFYLPVKRKSKEDALSREIIHLLINHARFYSLRADVTTDSTLYKKVEVMLMDDVDSGHKYLKKYKLKDGQIIKGTDKRFREFQPPMNPAFSVIFSMAK
jgi:hypothetical protein